MGAIKFEGDVAALGLGAALVDAAFAEGDFGGEVIFAGFPGDPCLGGNVLLPALGFLRRRNQFRLLGHFTCGLWMA